MEPVLMALQKDYAEKVAFVIVNVREREGQELAFRYNIRNIPHTIIVDTGGEVLLNQAGTKTEGSLRAILDEVRGRE